MVQCFCREKLFLKSLNICSKVAMGSCKGRKSKFGLPSGKYCKGRRKRNTGKTGRKGYSYSCVETNPLKLKFCRKLSIKKVKKLYEIYRHNGILYKRTINRKLGEKNNGYRLFNIDILKEFIERMTFHASTCGKALLVAEGGCSPVQLTSEVQSKGLAGIYSAKCNGCKESFRLESSPTLDCGNFDVNMRAVWGTLVTGNGSSHLNELLALMDTPGLTGKCFSAIEYKINQWWKDTVEKDLEEAIEEEKQLAIKNGCFHQGVPAITVICDGGWSKRSHKHSYNALGGVGVVIGANTKKILHIGVRNKFCYICTRAKNVGCEAKPHVCFKNWSQSSQAMEADIIIEGFKKADKMGVRYMNIIGDGDSSVFAKIREEVPIWGQYVMKKECANHMCKCLRSNLEKLVDDNPSFKGKGNLTQSVRIRIVSAVRCAIRMRSSMENKSQAKRLLEKDIKNSVFHIFGVHDNCSTDFCRAKSNDNMIDISKDTTTKTNDDILTDQINFWTNGSSICEQEESRIGTNLCLTDHHKKMIFSVQKILNRVSEKSERLLGNFISNLCESWMHVRTKFDGGKVFNHCNRFSWNTRCYAGALRTNIGPQWVPYIWEEKTNSAAGHICSKHYQRKERTLEINNEIKAKPETKRKRWAKKTASVKQSKTKKARQSYGPEAVDVTPDLSDSELKSAMELYLQKNINIDTTEIDNIQQSTLDQSKSDTWLQERQKRLTSSVFGNVLKRNPKIKITPIVKSILYSTFTGTKYTKIGIDNEPKAIEDYMKSSSDIMKVEKMGLCICKDHKFLAASPDGKVTYKNGDYGLIEIKNILYDKNITLRDAATQKKSQNFCLEILQDGDLHLKKNHNYYFQCQGLLNVTNYPWLDFIVRTENPYAIHIERIKRDNDLFHTWLPKLKAFYFKVLLPELAVPRYGKIPGIRELKNKWFDNPVAAKPQQERPTNTKEHTATSVNQPQCRRRTTREKTTKFLGRTISHQWKVNGRRKWFSGTVLSVVSGVDGKDAVYEVQYEHETEPLQVDHLIEDFKAGQVKFEDC